MKTIVGALAVVLALGVVPGEAADPVTQTFDASVDRAWNVARAVLKQLGWDIDKEDRSIGWITTDSRRVEGEDYGVYAKGIRHRLRIQMKAVDNARTSVTVERSVFERERILFIDNDKPIAVKDQTVEKSVLAAIGRSL
jgi:hypothetical protein